MKKIIILLLIVGFLGGLVTLNSGLYIVKETEQVIITQFGKPVGGAINQAGLHWKTPFIQTVNRFEKRILEWDGNPDQRTTKDKKFIWVDTYARWQIADPLLYFQRLRTEERAQSRLDDILDGASRNVVARYKLVELVRLGVFQNPDLPNVQYGREKLAKEVLAEVRPRVKELGIELLDFEFKRVNYVQSVRKEVYARMISERHRIAEQYRSEGRGEAARIEGRKDRELKQITSEAYRKAEEIKGKAEKKAAQIYAKAYAADPEFYEFYKTLETYRETLDPEARLIFTTDSRLFRLLKEVKK